MPATATVTYIAAHGPVASRAGVVHGLTVAFGVGTILIALGAVASAVFVRAGASDLQNLDLAPAPAEG